MSSINALQTQQSGRVDHHPDSSTPQRGTPPQKQQANPRDWRREDASNFFRRNVTPEDSDEAIRKFLLRYGRIAVQDALEEQDPKRKEDMADEDEFSANVMRNGEQDFINSLRDMALADSWERLFDDGTFFSSFDSKYSEHLLYLDIFLKPKPSLT
jgi:hypothetical protein